MGELLRRSPEAQSWTTGPDYVRVLFDGAAPLSVVVNTTHGNEPTIRTLELTSCQTCSEQERFVEDLIWRSKLGVDGPILVPSFDLSLTRFLEENPDYSSHWVAMLQTRNHKGKLTEYLLEGATLLESEDGQIRVQYTDGFVDTWEVLYEDYQWALDYNSLALDSPLRMARRDMWRWRDPSELQKWALLRWRPTWTTVNDNLGMHIGSNAIGSAIDPLDQSVLIAVLDMDRVLAGIIRVDPYGHKVTQRIPTKAPSTRTSLPIDHWYERWFFEVSPDRTSAVLYLPSRLWQVDLTSGTLRLLESAKNVSVVAIGTAGRDDQNLVAAATSTHIAVYGGEALQHLPIPAPIIALAFSHQGLVAVSSEGQTLEYPLDGSPPFIAGTACCDNLIGEAAVHPSGDEVLLSCQPGCGRGWERTSLEGAAPVYVEGVPTQPGGLSWSPSGDRFVTGSSTGGLVLWDAVENRPLAEFHPPGRTLETHWTSDGSALITRNSDGDVYWWSVDQLQTKRGLR